MTSASSPLLLELLLWGWVLLQLLHARPLRLAAHVSGDKLGSGGFTRLVAPPRDISPLIHLQSPKPFHRSKRTQSPIHTPDMKPTVPCLSVVLRALREPFSITPLHEALAQQDRVARGFTSTAHQKTK